MAGPLTRPAHAPHNVLAQLLLLDRVSGGASGLLSGAPVLGLDKRDDAAGACVRAAMVDAALRKAPHEAADVADGARHGVRRRLEDERAVAKDVHRQCRAAVGFA
jgi:hypothetical protein